MAVTEVLFDPRIDLPDGNLGVQAVTVKASPTRIREAGPSTVYPQTVTFTNVTAGTPLHFQSTDGTWAWTIGVYLRSKLLDVRTVLITGATAAWADLTDITPADFETPEATEAWWAALDILTARVTAVEQNGGGGGGGGGPTGFQYTQAVPAATWTIPHTFGRRPAVTLYLTDGTQILADVSTTTSQVSASFASPTTGFAVLT